MKSIISRKTFNRLSLFLFFINFLENIRFNVTQSQRWFSFLLFILVMVAFSRAWNLGGEGCRCCMETPPSSPYKCGTAAHVEKFGKERLILESSLLGNIHLAEYLFFEAPTNPGIQAPFFFLRTRCFISTIKSAWRIFFLLRSKPTHSACGSRSDPRVLFLLLPRGALGRRN